MTLPVAPGFPGSPSTPDDPGSPGAPGRPGGPLGGRLREGGTIVQLRPMVPRIITST